MAKIVDRILPTTMVGSYPRPAGSASAPPAATFVAFKKSSTKAATTHWRLSSGSEEAGLDIVTDGNMW
jgi:methionine synthase II (cobalamin-independent)